MNDRSRITGRMVWGVIVLSLGVLWTLDNLGQIDASQVVQWWPLIALAWGLMLLTGTSVRRRPLAGWIWTIIGGFSLLRPLGIANVGVFDMWPVLLILIGAMIVVRAWRGTGGLDPAVTTGPRIEVSAFMAGSQRKIVSREFSTADVNAVLAGTTLDFRPSKLANARGVVDVFAMWGGIDLIIPPEWRVVSEVTPILGVFQDETVVPADPDAPTLVVRGTIMMGGIEVRNDERKGLRTRVRGQDHTVQVGPGFVRVGVIKPERRSDAPESRASGTESP
jgi:hypothetical protein